MGGRVCSALQVSCSTSSPGVKGRRGCARIWKVFPVSMGKGGGPTLKGVAWSTFGWLTLGVMLFGASLTMSFGLFVAGAAGDAGHVIVKSLPVFAERVQGDAPKPAKKEGT